MRILIIGDQGQVAFELQRTLAPLGTVLSLGRNTAPKLDLEDNDSLVEALRTFEPHLIVNAAAYTAVDRAETEPDKANRINGEAIGVLVEEARRLSAGIVHYSTDYVFSGDQAAPYTEEDPVSPLGVYGSSKLLGEQILQESGLPHLIFRTSWVYGLRGQNFLLTMLRLMQERETLGIVEDQMGAPTWSRMIAEATALSIIQCTQGTVFDPQEKSGLYHLSAGGETSWFGFAKHIQSIALENAQLKAPLASLRPIPTSEYPTPARRPAYSVLSNRKIEQTFGLRLPEWSISLKQCLSEIESKR